MEDFVDKMVTVCTMDGRHLLGTLKGVDHTTNLILQRCVENVYSQKTGELNQVPLGLYIVRGNNVSFVGEVDESKMMMTTTTISETPSSM